MIFQYGFLYILAGVWLFFASLNDFKTQEVPNWLSYSFIAFALTFRVFYALEMKDFNFLFYGILGLILFVLLAFAFYYAGAFGGGDAKLLMGLGLIFPFSSIVEVFYLGLFFIIFLFSIGAIYTFIFSFYLIYKSLSFKKTFLSRLKQHKYKIFIPIVLFFIFVLLYFHKSFNYFAFSFLILAFLPLIYAYIKTVDECCMVKLVKWDKLKEGDWLTHDVRIGKYLIKKNVHGLSRKDIDLVREHRKKVEIRTGLPFTFVFFLAFMGFVYLLSRFSFFLALF